MFVAVLLYNLNSLILQRDDDLLLGLLPVIDKLTVHYIAPFQHSHINEVDSSSEVGECKQVYHQTFHVRLAFIIDNLLNVMFGYCSLGCLLIHL